MIDVMIVQFNVNLRGGACDGDNFKDMKYERRVPSQPGYQWNDAGGYCGSWSVQRAALAKGAWISQQQGGDSIRLRS